MILKITATFVQKRFENSGSDSVMDYIVYEFTNITSSDGNKFKDKWFKITKLLENVNPIKGKKYSIELSQNLSKEAVNMPFPVKISDGKNTFIKSGGYIKKISHNDEEINLSPREKRLSGEPDLAAMKKLANGLLTEDYLKKKNAKGVFFKIHYYDPTDKRKGGGNTYGFSNKEKGNYVLVEKATQVEIDKDVRSIKENYIKSIEKYFTIDTKIVPKKTKK